MSNPRNISVNNHDVAMVDVEGATSTECFNCISGSREQIRKVMDQADRDQFDEIMEDEKIRSTFEATISNEDEE